MQRIKRQAEEKLRGRHHTEKHKYLIKVSRPFDCLFGSDNIYKTLIENTKYSEQIYHLCTLGIKPREIKESWKNLSWHGISEMFSNFLDPHLFN